MIALSRSPDHPTVAAVISGRPASEDFGKYIRRFQNRGKWWAFVRSCKSRDAAWLIVSVSVRREYPPPWGIGEEFRHLHPAR